MTGELILDSKGVVPVMDGGYHPVVGKKGIGDCLCCAGPLLIWMVIDEDEAAYGGTPSQGYCGCYEEPDTQKLRELYEQYPMLMGTTVCNRVKSASQWYVHAKPPGVHFRDWARPPLLETLKADFRSDITRFDSLASKIYFYTIVDNSGSMTTATVQPGWGQFLNWLSKDFANEDDRFVQVHTISSGFPERWILFIQDQMAAYIKEMNLKAFTQTSIRTAIPGTYELEAWRDYRGPYCKWMRDTGVVAPGNCLSHYVECTNPECPVSENATPSWKTRFCNPENCRYFEL